MILHMGYGAVIFSRSPIFEPNFLCIQQVNIRTMAQLRAAYVLHIKLTVTFVE
jgi:hypothetical protein